TGLNGTTVVIIGAGTCYILANQSGNDLFDVAPEVGQQLIVHPKQITVNAENKTKIYGESDPEFTYTWIPELISGDSFSGELTREPGENTGQTYEIQQGSLTAGDNYSIIYNSAYLTINPKTIVVTATPGQSKLYWTLDPSEYTYSITSGSLVGTDSFSGELNRVAGENVGLYEILIGTLSLGTNYELIYESDNFEITPRNITVTANPDQSKQYGMFDPIFTYSFSEFPLAGNTFTGSLSREPGEDIGLYNLTLGTLSLGNNYTITFISDVFEITQRDLNIMVYENQYKSYGQEDPVLTFWLSGTLVNGDEITGELSRQPGENIGFYDINLGTLDAGPNYNLILFPQDFEIRTMMIVVIADPAQTKVYGDPNPLPYTYSYFGTLAPGDNFGGALSRVSGENIGEYQITQGSLSLNSNYSLSFISDYFEITKRPITVTADPGQTKMYGTENPPAYTYSVTSGNLVGTDAFNGTIKRYLGEDVGEYTIHQGNLTLSNNYQLTYISDIFTITPASITIIVDAGQNKIYGNDDPIFTYTTNVPLVYGDSFTGALSRTEGENIGTYAINQGSLNPGPNYNFSFVPANFQILIKNIVVSADENQFKNYGDEDPELTYHTNSPIASWDNFTGSLTREAGEDLGLYEISQGSLALNSNYNMSYVGDDFEIVARPITVTADAGQNKIYGDADPAIFTYDVTGTLVGGDTFTGALSREAGENAGLYEITIGNLALTSNYDLVYIPADFEILKATPIISWENPADIYNNEALSATQLNATADVEGSFTYNPDFGEFLSVGDNQELTCSFTPTDADNYNTTEKTVYINVLLWVGMSDYTNNELSVYPNPSDGIFNFDVKNQVITNISICDINGKELISKNEVCFIDISDFAAGVYFAKIRTEQNTYVARIIRQ
ncbi:MAG: MBG domain-containing protein, partial [Bacteroidales bacterium]|nr:MBG domain-containing protein [Bacteroidales bacterium]